MLKIVKDDLLRAFLAQVPTELQQTLDQLHDAELSTRNFKFHLALAAVFSSKIEGENIELDSYIKHKRDGKPDYT
jgi:hypothetical protein